MSWHVPVTDGRQDFSETFPLFFDRIEGLGSSGNLYRPAIARLIKPCKFRIRVPIDRINLRLREYFNFLRRLRGIFPDTAGGVGKCSRRFRCLAWKRFLEGVRSKSPETNVEHSGSKRNF